MRILVDENCDLLLVGQLRKAGHDVARVVELAEGAPDDDVLRIAKDDNRVLVTQDLDFGALLRLDGLPAAIVLLRTHPLTVRARADLVVNFFADLRDDHLGKLFVIEPGNVRARSYTDPTGPLSLAKE